jgi:hypothetical protein
MDKENNNINNKDKNKKKTYWLIGILLTFLIIPIVSAYTLPIPMMDLWTLFVDNIFGSFWTAIIFIIIFFFIILMLGGISYYSITLFITYFLLAMSMGYGNPIITLVIILFGIGALGFGVYKFMNNQ